VHTITRLFSVLALMLFALLFAPSLAHVYAGDLPPASQAVAPATRAASPDWPRLLAQLASASFQERQAAQAILDTLPPDVLDQLESRAHAAPDAEVQARLLQRANDIRAYLAVHPAPFTFSLKDASLDQVVAAMNRSAGAQIITAKDFGTSRFTLTADHLSFPDLYLALSAQHPLYLHGAPYIPVLQLAQSSFPPNVSSGGFLFSGTVVQANEFRNNQFLAVPWYQLTVTIIPDPRVRIIRITSTPALSEARDAAGADLTGGQALNPAYPGLPEMRSTLPGLPASSSAHISLAAAGVTHLSRVRGSLKLLVAVEMKHIPVEDIETLINKPIPLPKGTLTVTSLSRDNGFRVAVQWSEHQVFPQKPLDGELNLVTCSFSDTAGQNLGSFCQELDGRTSQGSVRRCR